MEFISMICPITGDNFADTIIFSLIASVAFIVASKLTKSFADTTGFYNSSFMSVVHWLIRVLIFVFLLGIVLGMVHLIRWISSWQWWGYLILGLSIGITIFGIIIIRNRCKSRNKKAIKNEEE